MIAIGNGTGNNPPQRLSWYTLRKRRLGNAIGSPTSAQAHTSASRPSQKGIVAVRNELRPLWFVPSDSLWNDDCHLAQLLSNGLLKVILASLGENPKRGKDKLFSQILERARRSEGSLLLIFDEAHLLSGEALVDLRLLVSAALDRGPSLKILLAGQDHLRGTLKRSEYTDEGSTP